MLMCQITLTNQQLFSQLHSDCLGSIPPEKEKHWQHCCNHLQSSPISKLTKGTQMDCFGNLSVFLYLRRILRAPCGNSDLRRRTRLFSKSTALSQSWMGMNLSSPDQQIYWEWGLCEYAHTNLQPSPIIRWILLGGKPKWLPWTGNAHKPQLGCLRFGVRFMIEWKHIAVQAWDCLSLHCSVFNYF